MTKSLQSTSIIPDFVRSFYDLVRFSRPSQLSHLVQYALGLLAVIHGTQRRIGKLFRISASTFSRFLNSRLFSTMDLVHSRADHIRSFLSAHSLRPRYLVIDETVVRKYGHKVIENCGNFFSSLAAHPILSVSFLTAILVVRRCLVFPLLTLQRSSRPDSLTPLSLRLVDEVPRYWDHLILLVDGALLSGALVQRAQARGWVVIARLRATPRHVLLLPHPNAPVDMGSDLLASELVKRFPLGSRLSVRIPSFGCEGSLLIGPLSDKKPGRRLLFCSHPSMTAKQIMHHYRKRELVEDFFKAAKHELHFGDVRAYSTRAMERHQEIVNALYTAWACSQSLLPHARRTQLRDFVSITGQRILSLLHSLLAESAFTDQEKRFFEGLLCSRCSRAPAGRVYA